MRDRRFMGEKFRRQHVVDRFILDLACVRLKIAIELDGRHHLDQRDEDMARDAFLEANGWVVLRFWNSEVVFTFEQFLEKLALVVALRRDDMPLDDLPSP